MNFNFFTQRFYKNCENINMKKENNFIFEIYQKEYLKLKDEQRSRITFRDNLIYITLVSIGAVLSYATSDPKNYSTFLILPLSNFVLGLIWLLNDEKISKIRQYIENSLKSNVNELFECNYKYIFGWENFHRIGKKWKRRKFLQLLANELLYCISGLFSVFLFFNYSNIPFFPNQGVSILGIFEIVLIVLLENTKSIYSDIKSINS